MSRAYWVKLASSVSTTINAKDKAIHKVELDNVVPEGEMSDLLEGALKDSGWEKSSSSDGKFEKSMKDGVVLTWDLATNTVEAEANEAREVVRDIEVQGRGYDKQVAQREAERQLQKRENSARQEASIEEERLQKELTRKLGENEEERVREINGVLQKTYAEAIKRKARRMGNVTSVQESSDGGEYQLTITISE